MSILFSLNISNLIIFLGFTAYSLAIVKTVKSKWSSNSINTQVGTNNDQSSNNFNGSGSNSSDSMITSPIEEAEFIFSKIFNNNNDTEVIIYGIKLILLLNFLFSIFLFSCFVMKELASINFSYK